MDPNNQRLMEELTKLKSKNGYLYAGLPKFMALFGRDSLISSWELARFDINIGINTIAALSRLQGKEDNEKNGEAKGKILHEFYDNDELFESRKKEIPWLINPNYFSVDSTPLYFVVMDRLERASAANIHDRFRKNIIDAYNFLMNREIIDGLARYYKPENGIGLQSQSWRDGAGDMLDNLKAPVAVVGVQGYLYTAINYLDRLSEELEELDRELILNQKEMLAKQLRSEMWIENISYFALARGGNGEIVDAITSDPGHLLFSGILNRKEERDVVDTLFDPELFTEYGIRTLSSEDKRFDPFDYQRGSIWPHDNWIIATGLRERGYKNEYSKLRESIFNAYDEIGYLPEYYSVGRDGNIIPAERLKIKPCYPQAWSTGALIDLLFDDH